MQEPCADDGGDEAGNGARGEERPRDVGREVEREAAEAERPGGEAGDAEVAPRRDEQQGEAGAADGPGDLRQSRHCFGARTITAARSLNPLAVTVSV